MLKRFIPFSFLLFFVFSLGAQRPSFVPVDMHVISDASRVACDNKAGTCTQALTPSAQSNDKKYLCFKDKLNITHAKDQNLSSDPDSKTPAGVGYLFSNCKPTKTGPTIQDIAADPCAFKSIPPTAFGFSVFTGGNLKGDVEFFNDGYLQQTYNANKPISLFFSPITYDKLTPSSVIYEGKPEGACVNVTTSNAFEVVYLNEIKGTVTSQGNLSGSFKAVGGLSEYDNATNYAITISLKSNPAKKGTVTSGAAKHNGTVNFTVPENGSYLVSVEDGKSCGTVFEIVASIALDFSVKNDTVCADNKGQLFIIPSGGVAPYQYYYEKIPVGAGSSGPFTLPTNGIATPNLDGGDYNISIKDATGTFSDTKVGSIVKANQILAVTLSQNDPSCANILDGNVTANAIGGFVVNKNYYYTWNNGPQGSNQGSITGLGIGTYSVTVTDNFGCTTDAKTNLTGVQPMEVTVVKNTNATCIGAKDGQVRFDVKGGNPNAGGNYESFDFSWNNGKNTFSSQNALGGFLPNADPGDYNVTVTDSKGCKLATVVKLIGDRILKVKRDSSDAKCFGQKDGAITLQISQEGKGSNSTSPLIFSWSPNPSTTPPSNTAFTTSYTGVGAGLYKVTITDPTYGCILYDSIRVKQPKSALDAKITTKNDPTCAGNSANGKIEITVTGGTPSYAFKWDKSTSNSSSASNLIAGTYTITVSDANGCSQVVTATLNDPPGPKVTDIQVKDVNCFTDNNGSIKVTATAANAADVLTYAWSNGGKTAEIPNLKPNVYTVTITDQKGCAIIRDTIVKSPPLLEQVGSAAITKPSCPSTTDGKIELTITGGTPKYTYNWKNQNGDTGSKGNLDGPSIMIEGLKVGIYDITITDQNNCPGLVISLIDVTTPPIITLTKVLDKDVDCFLNTCNGKATVTVTAGNSPTGSYNFAWKSGSFGSGKINEPISADNLCKGWNTITVSDTRCDYVDSIFVGAPAPITYDTTSLQIVNATCFGNQDGSITVSGKGGASPYTYSWLSPTSNSSTIKDLAADDYILTIKDSKNCEFVTTITVSEPPALVVTVERADSLKCSNSKDGRITLNATGGNDAVAGQPKYTFAWPFNVSTTATADKLGAGTYSITVTDSKGCATVKDTMIGLPDAIIFTLDTITAPLCNGYTTEVKLRTAKGGSGSQLASYSLVVNDQELPRGVSAQLGGGKHRINVADPDGCLGDKDLEIDIQEPPRIRVYLGKDVELELGDSYEINAVIESTVPVAKYNWSTSVGATPLTFSDSCKTRCGQLIKPLVDGSYILQVEDSVGCVGADTLNLSIDRNRNIFIPNIFSPNVDGTNDFFEVFADPQSVEQINFLRVYDRWGTMVFESPSFIPQASRVNGNRWNGYYKDGEANIGVYVYVCEVKFIDGLVLVFRGDVMLAR
jgi:gliding motility-associated-like protein